MPVRMPSSWPGMITGRWTGSGLPSRDSFESSQDFIKSFPQVLQDMVAIQADAMLRMDCRGRAAHQNCARYQILDVAFSRKHPFPIWKLGFVAHTTIVTSNDDDGASCTTFSFEISLTNLPGGSSIRFSV